MTCRVSDDDAAREFDAPLARTMAAMVRAWRAIDVILFNNDRASERLSSALSEARLCLACPKRLCEAVAELHANAHGGGLPERRARGSSGTFPPGDELSMSSTLSISKSERAMSALSTVLTVAMHAAVLLVFCVPFGWQLVALSAAGYVLRMWAITAGYHRYFSHRSYKTSRAFQLVLAVLGTMAMQNGPLWWASWHRRHHRHSDTPDDAHSPVQRGFWHAHIGWFLDGSHDRPNLANVRDLARYPELRFLDRHKWLPLVAYAGAMYCVAGFPGVVWGFVVSSILCLHATACINSLAHVWGSRRFDTSDSSRNNALLAIFTLGEGWHNNHHHDMACARQGLCWWEVDVTYYSLLALQKLGVIWDVREPRRLNAPAR